MFHDDLKTLQSLDGLHYGLLTDEEKLAFLRLKSLGQATVEYSGAAGLLGISRIRLLREGDLTQVRKP